MLSSFYSMVTLEKYGYLLSPYDRQFQVCVSSFGSTSKFIVVQLWRNNKKNREVIVLLCFTTISPLVKYKLVLCFHTPNSVGSLWRLRMCDFTPVFRAKCREMSLNRNAVKYWTELKATCGVSKHQCCYRAVFSWAGSCCVSCTR